MKRIYILFLAVAVLFAFSLTASAEEVKAKSVNGTSHQVAAKAPATSITSLKGKSNSFTVKWTRKSGVKGYQIRYAKNASMKNAKKKTINGRKTTEKKVTSLASNYKYYVQVRTFKKVNGKKVYSGWSKKKTVSLKGTKAKYSTKMRDQSRRVNTTYVNYYFERIVLKGNTRAIQKINRSIQKESNAFFSDENGKRIFEYAEENTYEYPFNWYVGSAVTYCGHSIISIAYDKEWYAGGVSNSFIYGRTYSLKTGEELHLGDVCEGKASAIKKRLMTQMKKDLGSLHEDALDKVQARKLSTFDFYLLDDYQAVVCFEPYEVGYGGWPRTYTIKSKYQ